MRLLIVALLLAISYAQTEVALSQENQELQKENKELMDAIEARVGDTMIFRDDSLPEIPSISASLQLPGSEDDFSEQSNFTENIIHEHYVFTANITHGSGQTSSDEENGCSLDTWNPGWGSTPTHACESWFKDLDWGANGDCNACDDPDWAQVNCAGTCCKLCGPENDGLLPELAGYRRNIDYIFRGYDIFKGNPVPFDTLTGIDLGFRDMVLKPKYDLGSITADRRYKMPDHTRVYGCQGSCSVEATAYEVSTSSEYTSMLSQKTKSHANAKWGSLFEAKFSYSTEYKHVNQYAGSRTSKFTYATASCCSYIAEHDRDGLDSIISDNFKKSIDDLPVDYDQLKYGNIIQWFGTHFLINIQMGSSFTKSDRFEESKFEELNELLTKEAVSASFHSKFMKFEGGAGHEDEQSEESKNARNFTALSAETKTVTIGSRPPLNEDANTWAATTANDPMPIQYTLMSIAYLLSPNFAVQYTTPNEDMEKKYDNLLRYLDEYCSIIEPDLAVSCDGPAEVFERYDGFGRWNSWITGNDAHHHEFKWNCPNNDRGNKIHSIRSVHEGLKGLVDLEVECKDGTKHWYTGIDPGPHGDSQMRIIAQSEGMDNTEVSMSYIQVREHSPHGIINIEAKIVSDVWWGQEWWSGWNHPDVQTGDVKGQDCEDGSRLVGLEVRSQDGHGIVDIKPICAVVGMKCSDEGGECWCAGEVRFGRWTWDWQSEAVVGSTDWKPVVASVACTPDSFVVDQHISGGRCWCRSPPKSEPGYWSYGEFCAGEGGFCQCNGRVLMAAKNSVSLSRSTSDGLECSIETLSDPSLGNYKNCYCSALQTEEAAVAEEAAVGFLREAQANTVTKTSKESDEISANIFDVLSTTAFPWLTATLCLAGIGLVATLYGASKYSKSSKYEEVMENEI